MGRTFARVGKPAADEPLHYKKCGLDDVYLLNGYTVHETPCGKGVSVEDVDGLHHAIALSVVRNKAVLNGKEIKFLRKLMGFTQADLARKLRCDVQSVARWEKGQNDINGSSDLCVRAFYLGQWTQSLDLIKLADDLAEMNVNDFPQFFEETDGGWRSRAA